MSEQLVKLVCMVTPLQMPFEMLDIEWPESIVDNSMVSSHWMSHSILRLQSNATPSERKTKSYACVTPLMPLAVRHFGFDGETTPPFLIFTFKDVKEHGR